jgi:hypothetical protein
MRTMESQTTNIACLGLDSELSFRFSFEWLCGDPSTSARKLLRKLQLNGQSETFPACDEFFFTSSMCIMERQTTKIACLGLESKFKSSKFKVLNYIYIALVSP